MSCMEEISTSAYCCTELNFNLFSFLLQARAFVRAKIFFTNKGRI